jgi:hypothetical protein
MPFHDGGKQCGDPSECESKMCIIDIRAECTPGVECDEPVLPKPGERAVGICKLDDVRCGSYIEIRNGRAQEIYHID